VPPHRARRRSDICGLPLLAARPAVSGVYHVFRIATALYKRDKPKQKSNRSTRIACIRNHAILSLRQLLWSRLGLPVSSYIAGWRNWADGCR
jgi:hypothetical protein